MVMLHDPTNEAQSLRLTFLSAAACTSRRSQKTPPMPPCVSRPSTSSRSGWGKQVSAQLPMRCSPRTTTPSASFARRSLRRSITMETPQATVSSVEHHRILDQHRLVLITESVFAPQGQSRNQS